MSRPPRCSLAHWRNVSGATAREHDRWYGGITTLRLAGIRRTQEPGLIAYGSARERPPNGFGPPGVQTPRDTEVIMTGRHPLQCILPPDVLHDLARSGDAATRAAALDSLLLDHQFRLTRAESAARSGGFSMRPITFSRIGGHVQRTIYDQQHKTSQSPGKMVRGEGQAKSADLAVNQAYDGLGYTYDFYWKVFQRDSINGQGMPLLGMV